MKNNDWKWKIIKSQLPTLRVKGYCGNTGQV